MLGFGEPSVKKLTRKLSNQMIGFQSLMYRLCYENLGIKKDNISRIEITYFSMTIVILSALYLSKRKNKMAAVDEAQINVLKSSLPHSGGNMTLNDAVSQYQERFDQYRVLFDTIVRGQSQGGEIELAIMFVDKASQGTAGRPSFIGAHQIFAQVIDDNLDFAKNIL